MINKLQSPTCKECAQLRGYEPVRLPLGNMFEGICANCRQKKGLYNAQLWVPAKNKR